jgi:hypothetical protein
MELGRGEWDAWLDSAWSSRVEMTGDAQVPANDFDKARVALGRPGGNRRLNIASGRKPRAAACLLHYVFPRIADITYRTRRPSGIWRMPWAAPASHQKRPEQTATNAIKNKRSHSKINKADRYPVAHNGLVAGSSPAGPTSKSTIYEICFASLFELPPQKRPCSSESLNLSAEVSITPHSVPRQVCNPPS